MTNACVFPGQGSQAVGMGKDVADSFAEAREVFEEVDDALDARLSKIIFEGPEDALTLTENAQPAIMATSMAILRVLQKQGGFDLRRYAGFVAGHSLGEYTALAAAGAFSLRDAARLLRLRGRAMQAAVPAGQGAMAAVLGLDLDQVGRVATEAAAGEICEAANDNAPGQVVVSGSAPAVDRAMEIARGYGAKRAVKLAVSAPFHCALMEPAAAAMEEALAGIALSVPAVPLIANVTASPISDPEEIRRLLVKQVTGMVRWRESVQRMKKEGVARAVEIGAGKVLSGLIKRIEPEIETISVATPAEIEAFLKGL